MDTHVSPSMAWHCRIMGNGMCVCLFRCRFNGNLYLKWVFNSFLSAIQFGLWLGWLLLLMKRFVRDHSNRSLFFFNLKPQSGQIQLAIFDLSLCQRRKKQHKAIKNQFVWLHTVNMQIQNIDSILKDWKKGTLTNSFHPYQLVGAFFVYVTW